jgi:hypothetical protein
MASTVQRATWSTRVAREVSDALEENLRRALEREAEQEF